ncbi:sensor histidine kinase [Chryseobacterium oryctis]|uniref:Histidine kinase n=1 Tax=Chryseobacterium oryctis TaxID=2952618 RepID=A0ABT3HQM0_9FLAO|nr:histidine kinase [Chryseobacterium oryctis]MCW3162057.1 histidine kinase [Chryseobacterium oryctis]
MTHIQDDIKLAYIVAISIMMLFVCFIVFVVLMYNKRQLLYIKEKQLKETEYQNQLLQKELEKQKLIEKERERISHDMHDDLGAGISALKLQAEFLKQKSEDKDLKNDIDELMKISEEMNLSMREMLWSLNSGNDTLGNFIDYAKIYSESFLKKSKIQLLVKIGEGIDADVPISTDLRRNMFLCLKEALNNAYKHSQANKIEILFLCNGKEFSMEISDDGIGINNQSEGNGLRNMKRRMQEQNGECIISSSDIGTTLHFKIEI